MPEDPIYADRFETIRFERRDGILQMTLHTDGGPLRWGAAPVAELQQAFAAVAADTENRVVILTGTGDEFNGPKGSPDTFPIATPAAGSSRTGTCASSCGTCSTSSAR